MSASGKIDFNKFFEKYQIDSLFKINCLVGKVLHRGERWLEMFHNCAT
jgi:hypothetical protein